jgi:hypothetical protein
MDSRRHVRGIRIAIASIAAIVLAGCAAHTPAKTATSVTEQRFSSPKAAVDALLSACRANDEPRLLAIFGEQAKPIVSTGDPGADRERCQKLLDAAQQATRLDPKGPDMLQLVVGSDDWHFPVPLVKDGRTWRFDTAAGMEEIERRRVGADELEAITACRTYVLAQAEYASRTKGRVYAQKLSSSPGKKDGLYWPSTGRNDVSPLGAMVATGGDDANGERPRDTWRGYHFRILTAQGDDAPGGKRSYVVKGQMTRGFALVAYPVAYGSTGIMTFIVGSDGRVYEKDLGVKTDEAAAAMTEYDPDRTWKAIRG